ncbi:MAG: twin-arginine translocase subunit TatC [Deltaproteobacteria bacterium]|nr:twin-arginine translocase subunit TatC [Deltaproteobacteria bacterium]
MSLPFWEHLDELRSRLLRVIVALVVTTGIAFFFADWLLAWLMKPSPTEGVSLIALQPATVFIQSLRISLLGGVVFALPYILSQVYAFITPGLTDKEKKVFLFSLYIGTVLFLLGLLFAYYFVVPTALNFFWEYSHRFGVKPSWTIDYYIQFVLMFLASFGICFELPFVMVLLIHFRLISAEQVAAKRPHIIVGLAIIAGIMTPPDVVSQLLLLVPLWLLFEIALFISKRSFIK